MLTPLLNVAATFFLRQMLARYRQQDVFPLLLPFLQATLDGYQRTAPGQRDMDAHLKKVRPPARCLRDFIGGVE